VLLEAFLTVDWSTLGWLEWNLGFFSAVAAGDLSHLAWTTVVAAPFSITHIFHSSYVIGYLEYALILQISRGHEPASLLNQCIVEVMIFSNRLKY
jgi:hypothetical protein